MLNARLMQIVYFAARVWVLLLFLIVAYSNFGTPALVETSDYVSCLWTGAKMVATGRFHELYAPYGATTFIGEAMDVAAHQWLPHLPKHLMAEFNYSPLSAWLLVPLSYLPPNVSLFVWQVLGVCAVALGAFFLAPRGDDRPLRAFVYSFSLLPVAIALWIGQTDLVYGIPFYSGGLWLLWRNKPWIAGLVLAAACMKPQFIVMPGLVALVLLLQKQWRLSVSFGIGLLLLAAFNVACSSPEIVRQWLWEVSLAEKLFTQAHSGFASHLMVSLPGQILHAFPREQFPWVKPAVYATAFSLGLFTAFVCARFARRAPNPELAISASAIAGVLLMPFVVPNYMLYDMSMLIIPGMLVFRDAYWQSAPFRGFFWIITTTVLINLYAILMMGKSGFVHPIMLVALMSVIFGAFLWNLLKARDNMASCEDLT